MRKEFMLDLHDVALLAEAAVKKDSDSDPMTDTRQDRINEAWRVIAAKHGFVWHTVEVLPIGGVFISAEIPKPKGKAQRKESRP